MRFLRIFGFLLFLVPTVSFGASNDFMVAAQLLAAAKNADIQQVQALINNGANVNYVDSTGLSIVCTALMNNDVRAAQILQMYGADASKCDRQIKQYNNKNKPRSSGGLFGGLSSAQSITLAAAGAAVVVGALFLLTDWFDPGNGNKSSSSGGSHGGGGNNGGSGSTNATAAFTLPDGPASLAEDYNYTTALDFYSPSDTDSIYYKNFNLMTNTYGQNYLLMMRGYSPLARGYMGMTTLRNKATNAPLSLAGNNLGANPVLGGRPVNVALITANGINAAAETSLADKLMPWTTLNNNGTAVNPASNDMISSKYYNNKINYGTDTATLTDDTTEEDSTRVESFDLSGHGTAINNTSATADDNLLAKVVAGSVTTGDTADFMGFMPNGQMTIFRTGGGNGFVPLATPTNAGTYTSNTDGALDTLTLSDVASGGNLAVDYNGTDISATRAYTGYIESGDILHFDTNSDGNADVSYSMVLSSDSNTNGVLQTIPTDAGTYTLDSEGNLATLTMPEVASGAELVATVSDAEGFTVHGGGQVFSGYIDTNGLMHLDTGNGIIEYSMTLNTGSTSDGILETVPVNMGTYTLDTDGSLMTLSLSDVASGDELSVSLDGTNIVAKDNGESYFGYIGTDGLLYFDRSSDGNVDVAYKMSDGTLSLVKNLSSIDYYNYRALLAGAALYVNGDTTGGRARPNILANASAIAPLHETATATTDDLLSISATTAEDYKNQFSIYVNNYYDVNSSDNFQGAYAKEFFNGLGSTYSPLVLFSTGAVKTDSSYSGRAYLPTFENAAPLVYGANVEHLFASIVTVGQIGDGTVGDTTISGYSPANKYALMQWQNTNGTPTDTTDDTYYRARMCGIAGTGSDGVDPWCFAATGTTDELAVASAAGAFGVLKSAFSYMTNQQIFALAALTADGAYLGSNDNGTAMSQDSLVSYLQGLYELPNEYQYQVNAGTMSYLDAFKQVFGYGLINVERATTPGKSVYYYNGTDIVSTSGNAYWRAASNTAFRSSSAFGARGATLQTSAFDVLTSVDGELSMPRVWTSEFALGTNSRHGLYMGDVLGELLTRDEADNRVQIGQIGFSMTTSQRAYSDNMGGLDDMKLDWTSGDWNVAAGYQRHFTDGASRFAGMNNPILGLASNAVMSDAKYNLDGWSFGARAFSGAITDESLLEYDPTISANYEPARLGFVRGVGASVGWSNNRVAFDTAVGTVDETHTVLGAYTDGLLGMGGGNTIYVDNELRFRPIDGLTLTARATFARTTTDGVGDIVLGVSPISSNAFALGADWGNFRFSVAQPLAVRHGNLKYAYANYNVVDTDDGNFALDIADTHIAEIDLSADKRELRFTGEYRHNFGAFTDGAIGFIYRVNPNNTDEFGNESIFMLKLTHRVGI